MRDYNTHQEHAYQRTGRLVLVFGAAIMGTVLTTGLVIAYLVTVVVSLAETPPSLSSIFLCSFLAASFICAVVVLIGSLWKLAKLRDGGAVIACDLGGTLLEPGSSDLMHRKILNVVEEIAIASGVPIPPVYVMEREDGINAFAAGYSPRDAIVAVTDGCLRRLSRDQLQGVVAHEFSHILNGDMRLNLRAIGFLHGILTITICTEYLIHEGWALLERPSHDGDSTVPGLLMVVAGAALWPVGLAGVFFGLLIKAALNRQREYLADASAVEFTRNPEGIAGALKTIGGYPRGGRIRNPMAVEASHLFFTTGYTGIGSWLDSHPPLEARIRRLDPEWDGAPLFESDEAVESYQGAFEDTMSLVGGRTRAANSVNWVGDAMDDHPDGEHPVWRHDACHTANVASSLPPDLIALADEPDGACVLLSALWLTADDLTHEAQKADETTLAMLRILEPLDAAQQLFLFDSAVKSLGELRGAARQSFRETADRFMTMDSTNVFRWAWAQVVLGRLGGGAPSPRYGSHNELPVECAVVLSALVHLGGDEGMAATYTFQRGVAHLDVPELELLVPQSCDLPEVDAALEQLAQVAPRARQQFALACGACITSDREVSEGEAFFIRGICSALHLPTPKVFPGQPVIPGA